MTAHLYCWDLSLGLVPTDRSFYDRIKALHRDAKPPPSPKLVAFVADLLVRYGDLTETDDTVWGDGPMVNNIIGDFINMSLIWSRYQEAVPFVTMTARKHGLHCFDPQTGEFYPAPAT
jgi:hypothetical protein